MIDRCVATNADGARCVYRHPHGAGDRHLYSDSDLVDSFQLGKLRWAVKSFLEGKVDRDFLAATLAETADRA